MVVLIAATVLVGCAVTVKADASGPLMVTIGLPERLSVPVSVFSMVKVLITVPEPISPKSVSSPVFGNVLPLAIEVPLPFRFISGVGTGGPTLLLLALVTVPFVHFA